LNKSKRTGESFSDVLRRVLGQKEDIMKFAGALKEIQKDSGEGKTRGTRKKNYTEAASGPEAAKRGYIG
jgi:predicted CopG family antitoxin